MALALNTSHALYADLVALICVDDDNTIKDLKGDTCTPHASVVIGSGTYGRHFRTTNSAGNSLGIALTNGFVTKPTANPVGTTFVVINAGNAWTSRGSVFNTISTNAAGPRVTTGDVVAAFQNDGTSAVGSVDIVGTGAHSFGVAYTGTSSHKAFTDGGNVVTSATNLQNASDAYKATYIGGHVTGGYGYFNADYVWVAHFRRFLSDTEIADLHASLGVNNAFGLVVSSATTTHALIGALAAQSASISAALSRSGSAVSHTLTGALSAQSAAISATAAKLVTGTFVTDYMVNNTGTPLASTPVVWEWHKGSIGAAPTSVTYGTGTTSAAGVLTVTGLPSGAGFLLYSTTDYANVAYQAGTVI